MKFSFKSFLPCFCSRTRERNETEISSLKDALREARTDNSVVLQVSIHIGIICPVRSFDIGICQVSYFCIRITCPVSFFSIGICQVSFFCIRITCPVSFFGIGICQVSFFGIGIISPVNLTAMGIICPVSFCDIRKHAHILLRY